MVKKYIKKAAKKGVKILKKKGGYSYTAKPKPKSKVKSTDTKTKKMQKAEYISKFGLVKTKPKGKPKSLKSATGSKAVVQDISMGRLLNAQDKIRADAKKAGQLVAIYRKNNPNNPNVKIYNQYMAKKKEKK